MRPEAEFRALAGAAAEQLVQAGAKALVVACNTATSAAIVQLREAYPDIPVIGTEPALKPAVEKYPGGRILVMATPMTIRQEKFQALKAQYDAAENESDRHMIALAARCGCAAMDGREAAE